jgi:hypothetical protein
LWAAARGLNSPAKRAKESEKRNGIEKSENWGIREKNKREVNF